MKVGDLVVFYSGFSPFARDYERRNPGIVLSITEKGGLGVGRSTSVEVLWCNKEVTTEHSGYIQLVEEEKHV